MSLDPQSPTTKEAVDAVLDRAGLPINQDEYDRLLRTYPFLRQSAAALRIPKRATPSQP